eukprot:7050414-Prymnesium_polylepis.1
MLSPGEEAASLSLSLARKGEHAPPNTGIAPLPPDVVSGALQAHHQQGPSSGMASAPKTGTSSSKGPKGAAAVARSPHASADHHDAAGGAAHQTLSLIHI